jgi:hypothetical protein
MGYSKISSAGGKATAIILRKKAIDEYYINPNICKNCGNVIVVKEKEKVSNVRKRSFCCSSCSASFNNKVITRTKKEKTNHNKEEKVFRISDLTKDELFKRYKNYQTARSIICKNSRKIFFNSNKEKRCIECGYQTKIDIAHIKSVSSFPMDAKISEINDIDNLVALCPNHHGEYDGGHIKINIAGWTGGGSS